MTVPATAPAKVRHNTRNRFRELAIHCRNLIPVSEIVRMRRRRSQGSGRRAGTGPRSPLRPSIVRRSSQKARSERRWSTAAFSGNGHDWTTGRSRDSNVGHFLGAFLERVPTRRSQVSRPTASRPSPAKQAMGKTLGHAQCSAATSKVMPAFRRRSTSTMPIAEAGVWDPASLESSSKAKHKALSLSIFAVSP